VPSTRSPVLIHQHIETWKGPSPVQGTEISFCKGQKFGKVLMTKELKRASLVFKCLICLLQWKIHEDFCLTNGHQLTKEKDPRSLVFTSFEWFIHFDKNLCF
jgi:hypothetical protein